MTQTSTAIYANSFPALSGQVVKEGHAQYCRDNGHATYVVDGELSPLCGRCGDVVPAPAVTTDSSISEAAKQALLSTGTNRQGAVPTHPMSRAVRQELEAAKLIGAGGGLTRRGTIARERAADAALPF